MVRPIIALFPDDTDDMPREFSDKDGARPTMIVGVTPEQLLGALGLQCVGPANDPRKGRVPLTGDQMVIVPNESEKQAASRYFDPASIFTIRACKGLGRRDVLLWNCISGDSTSLSDPTAYDRLWPLVFGFAQQALERQDVGGDCAKYVFDDNGVSKNISRTNELALFSIKLKGLYTAVARPKEHLLIYESAKTIASECLRKYLLEIYPEYSAMRHEGATVERVLRYLESEDVALLRSAFQGFGADSTSTHGPASAPPLPSDVRTQIKLLEMNGQYFEALRLRCEQDLVRADELEECGKSADAVVVFRALAEKCRREVHKFFKSSEKATLLRDSALYDRRANELSCVVGSLVRASDTTVSTIQPSVEKFVARAFETLSKGKVLRLVESWQRAEIVGEIYESIKSGAEFFRRCDQFVRAADFVLECDRQVEREDQQRRMESRAEVLALAQNNLVLAANRDTERSRSISTQWRACTENEFLAEREVETAELMRKYIPVFRSSEDLSVASMAEHCVRLALWHETLVVLDRGLAVDPLMASAASVELYQRALEGRLREVSHVYCEKDTQLGLECLLKDPQRCVRRLQDYSLVRNDKANGYLRMALRSVVGFSGDPEELYDLARNCCLAGMCCKNANVRMTFGFGFYSHRSIVPVKGPQSTENISVLR